MPSASTTSPFAASAATESSLCERTMPGSVALVISRISVRFKCALELDVDAAARGRGLRGCGATQGGAQRAGELLAGLEALVRILRQRAVEERDQRRRHVRVDRQDVDRVLVGDLEHELRHRFAQEWEVAGKHLVEADREREQVGAALDLLAGELLRRHVRGRAE